MSGIAPERFPAKTRPGLDPGWTSGSPQKTRQLNKLERVPDPEGTGTVLVTDADLARARQDPAFRHQLVANSLELLLRELNRLRSAGSDATRARQIREGVDLAVRLADLLQRIVGQGPGATRAA
jgi:hypothetical protein